MAKKMPKVIIDNQSDPMATIVEAGSLLILCHKLLTRPPGIANLTELSERRACAIRQEVSERVQALGELIDDGRRVTKLFCTLDARALPSACRELPFLALVSLRCSQGDPSLRAHSGSCLPDTCVHAATLRVGVVRRRAGADDRHVRGRVAARTLSPARFTSTTLLTRALPPLIM